MNIKKHIPNAITCGNLLCGCLGLLVTSWYRLDLAFIFMLLAAFLDFFDGFFARLLKVNSPIGKDLDSLADMVTFGVLPGFIMFRMLSISVLGFNVELAKEAYSSLDRIVKAGGFDSAVLIEFGVQNLTKVDLFLPFIAFLIPVFSAIRLAKFNNDTRQSDSFIGVPTPANAILIGSLGFILIRHTGSDFNLSYFSKAPLISLTLLMCYLLIAELPLFALKFKNFGWPDNKIRYSFLIISVLLLIVFQVMAIPFIIFLYIVLSVVNNRILKSTARKNNN
ncbi:MAG: phosphatidylserine synthase [Bacteroidetes bacterium]|nr:phosphatidylserine synthase [Bacteroidota bacterium]